MMILHIKMRIDTIKISYLTKAKVGIVIKEIFKKQKPKLQKLELLS